MGLQKKDLNDGLSVQTQIAAETAAIDVLNATGVFNSWHVL